MPTIYVRSTDGNNADNGSTWALAKANLAGADIIDNVGDVIWVSHVHNESATFADHSWAGSVASPVKIICANDGAQPPTALATSAVVAGTTRVSINTGASSNVYVYGIHYKAGDASTAGRIQATGRLILEKCKLELIGPAAGAARVNFGITGNNGRVTLLKDCDLKFGDAAHALAVSDSSTVGLLVHFQGGSFLAGTVSPTTLVKQFPLGGVMIFDGYDFSNCGSAMNFFDATDFRITGLLRNCRLPASWAGALHSGTPGLGSIFEMYNCDDGSTTYRYRRHTQYGTVRDESTIVRTGGASDGQSAFSWKIATNADAEYPAWTVDTPEIIRWNTTVGVPITVTIETLVDSLTALKDDEIWLEVSYLGTSGAPLGTFVSDRRDGLVTAGAAVANQAASGASWTTTGLTNPNTQKLHVTFTPQEPGYVHCVAKCAKASTTVYVDPKPQVS